MKITILIQLLSAVHARDYTETVPLKDFDLLGNGNDIKIHSFIIPVYSMDQECFFVFLEESYEIVIQADTIDKSMFISANFTWTLFTEK